MVYSSSFKKTALITGATSGIGSAIAKRLGSLGYDLLLHYHECHEKADRLLQELRTCHVSAILHQADLSDENQIVKMFEAVDGRGSGLDILVNNAGIHNGRVDIENLSLEKIHRVFAVNTFGTIICCREAVRRMKQKNRGTIVNIVSEAGTFGGNRMLDYAGSKAAINAMTKGLAREVGQYNIRVNAVSPGIIDAGDNAMLAPEIKTNLVNTIPLGRMGAGEDVADAVAWLVSGAAYVSGVIVSVAGGR